jgi:hypothetical protein
MVNSVSSHIRPSLVTAVSGTTTTADAQEICPVSSCSSCAWPSGVSRSIEVS